VKQPWTDVLKEQTDGREYLQRKISETWRYEGRNPDNRVTNIKVKNG